LSVERSHRFKGVLQFRNELGASHEPSLALALALDPGGESKSKSMIKSKTPRFMGIMQFWKELDASHEPTLRIPLVLNSEL
jgi:hypothetical protein